jgi:hypothetical protein
MVYQHSHTFQTSTHDYGYKITVTFDRKYLDPHVSTTEQFVDALEEHTLKHEALSHQLLQDLSNNAFGNEGTATKLLELFSAYRVVNKVSLILLL